MTTCLGKSCSFGLPRVRFVNCCQFMYLVISLLVLRAVYGIRLYQFLIIAYVFSLEISVPGQSGKFRAPGRPAVVLNLRFLVNKLFLETIQSIPEFISKFDIM